MQLEFADQMELVKTAYAAELDELPDDQVFRRLRLLLKRPDGEHDPTIARLFGLLFRRASISYKAERKMRLAKELSLLLLNEGRKKMITFFERIDSAEGLQSDVEAGGRLDVETAESLSESICEVGTNWCKVLHSGLEGGSARPSALGIPRCQRGIATGLPGLGRGIGRS